MRPTAGLAWGRRCVERRPTAELASIYEPSRRGRRIRTASDKFVPDDVSVERHTAETLPKGWDAAALQTARQFGDAWMTEPRTAFLIAPSVVVVRAEFNVLVNPGHPDATRIVVSEPQPVVWDERLFVMPPVGQS
ncbi:RES domain-containing protein [Burkholderia sp. Ac-20344]|nr:RES domain-containing protein [Burkholderia sp. Ac-20344]MBN3830392.1 RES domain-containing protein [Burkholderia sp. Ac-20344]